MSQIRFGRGASLIEVMIALIITVILMTAVYQIFSQGRKGADEAMRNHQINQDLQRVVDRLQNDIREASGIHPEFPPFYVPGVEKTTTPEDTKNIMVLQKAIVDFKKNPATLSPG
ncbi:MAG TPA: prepilin-type N-terminal cleavage/methylation domain-containing protein, partial [Candidatus Ozemobacteraceae bacterium]|nr:prepilin-type N-terminal cleavage/methylation domain-containing protein [Candidatus Ozemobacteraceae bacterium]